jgi:HEAT repeat protein
VVLSSDPEPGVRFSALVRLGRARTDRSVQASLARLDDPASEVVWQALRNLGGFRDRGTAPAIARMLDHPAAVVRGAALQALLRIGAPTDSGYDPAGPPGERAPAAERLRAWADE